MKKKDQRFTALYAAPGFFRPKPGEKEEGEMKEPPITGVYAAPDAPTPPENLAQGPEAPFMCVYAGPDWFAGKMREGAGAFAPVEPAPEKPAEYPENYAEPEPSAPFTEVYAGPDQLAPEEPAAEAPAEEHAETEEERIARLTEEFKNNPPAICGLVQADPEALRRNTGFMNMNMGMGMGANPRFCSECGAKAHPGDKFCRECGSKLL